MTQFEQATLEMKAKLSSKMGDDRTTLASILQGAATPELSKRFFADAECEVHLDSIAGGSCLADRASELRGRSVLISTIGQLEAALALIELDGVARRMVLCPPELAPEHLPYVIEIAEVDAVVSERAEWNGLECLPVSAVSPVQSKPAAEHETEWILLTSGTTGVPKLVVHTLASLAGAIKTTALTSGVVWSTFYDIRRYGGLQIFLRALFSGASMVFSDAREPAADFLARAGRRGITHISGTPSHWRKALMSPSARDIAPHYVRLSGEIADQPILNHLQSTYPKARIAHAFASTEAGLAFEVNDRREGFPVSLIGGLGEVAMKVEDDSLRIRSARIARRYLGGEPLAGPDGFVDTRDLVELRGDRYHFVGRRDGVINIGGWKVHPEEVESIINRHPQVHMSLVYRRKNPIMGAIVVADVVLKPGNEFPGLENGELQNDILLLCRKELASHKVPAAIKFVSALDVAETGKLTRTPCAT